MWQEIREETYNRGHRDQRRGSTTSEPQQRLRRTLDIFVGTVCLAVAIAGAVFERRRRSLPPSLTEPMGREMDRAAPQPQPPMEQMAS
mmetsp:Transcript_8531/g.9405  ORF Transcript_8531/g.9405 Transcript_8531/m.9405 type:complete len:88 (-) Transcript_8531:2-265(-)